MRPLDRAIRFAFMVCEQRSSFEPHAVTYFPALSIGAGVSYIDLEFQHVRTGAIYSVIVTADAMRHVSRATGFWLLDEGLREQVDRAV
jgi:hypothetical protein